MRGDTQIKIVSAKMTDKISNKPAGTLDVVGNRLYVSCGDGVCLEITELLPAGKKKMSASDYLRGNSVCEGEKLTFPV